MFKSSLLYKDILLLKDSLPLITAQLLFITVIISINLGITGYYMGVLSAQWYYLMTVSQKDKKNNAQNILLASAYTRKQLVANRYIFCLIIWAVVTLFYGGLSYLFGSMQIFTALTTENLAEGFFNSCTLLAITVPLYFVLDDSIVRYISICIIFGIALIRLFAGLDIFLQNTYATIAAALALLFLSGGVSVFILERLEL